MLKRLFDLLISAGALLLLVLPGLLLALAIRLDSPGPVFFRQERVGRHGRLFRIHKFRTMREAAEAAGQLTVGEDPRITRLGRWLRGHRLDELPQLMDVLRGDMSLVGPRPEVPRYVALYPAELKSLVLSVRPGITDPASLAYRHEAQVLAASADPERTYIEELLPAKLAASAEYARTASLWTDLKVLARSVGVLLRG